MNQSLAAVFLFVSALLGIVVYLHDATRTRKRPAARPTCTGCECAEADGGDGLCAICRWPDGHDHTSHLNDAGE